MKLKPPVKDTVKQLPMRESNKTNIAGGETSKFIDTIIATFSEDEPEPYTSTPKKRPQSSQSVEWSPIVLVEQRLTLKRRLKERKQEYKDLE